MFFGRRLECEAVFQQVVGGARVTASPGPRAWEDLAPARGVDAGWLKHGIQTLYLSTYEALEQEYAQAASRLERRAPDPRARPRRLPGARRPQLARAGSCWARSPRGALSATGPGSRRHRPARQPARPHARGAARLRLRVLASTTRPRSTAWISYTSAARPRARLGSLARRSTRSPGAGLGILEQTALQTGHLLRGGAGQPGVGGDFCRHGSTSPLDLQIVARAMLDLRITSLRRYERSGGSEALIPQFLDRPGASTRRPWRAARCWTWPRPASPAPTRSPPTQLGRETVDAALGKFVSRGVLKKREAPRGERFSLAHPAMRAHVEAYMALARARGDAARRVLRRRILASQRLSVPEQIGVRRHLGGALASDEAHTYRRSVRRSLLHISLACWASGRWPRPWSSTCALLTPLRSSRRASRPTRASLSDPAAPASPSSRSCPGSSPGDTLIADTGFAAAGLAPEVAARISAGKVYGPARARRGRCRCRPGCAAPSTAWRAGAPRGVALVLLGDSCRDHPLKQAFADLPRPPRDPGHAGPHRQRARWRGRDPVVALATPRRRLAAAGSRSPPRSIDGSARGSHQRRSAARSVTAPSR